MGHHQCEYCDYPAAVAAGLRAGMTPDEVKTSYESSKDTTLDFGGNMAWTIPAMFPLYVALGYEPPAEFVQAVMNAPIHESRENVLPKTMALDLESAQREGVILAEEIGYLTPEKDPLPAPFSVSENLPDGFMAKLREKTHAARGQGAEHITLGG